MFVVTTVAIPGTSNKQDKASPAEASGAESKQGRTLVYRD
jgi:hypothetical protein